MTSHMLLPITCYYQSHVITSRMLLQVTCYYKLHVVTVVCVMNACSSALVLWGLIHFLSGSVHLLSCVGIITAHGKFILIILLIYRFVYNLR